MGILGTLQIQTVALPCEQCRVASARCLHRNTTLLTTQPKMATAIFGFGLTRAPNRTWGLDRKNTIVGKSRWKEATAHNERFCEMAAVTPQTILCGIERLSPAGTLVEAATSQSRRDVRCKQIYFFCVFKNFRFL